MFSFAGDTVLDPFAGTGTTNLCAMELDRCSIGVEVEPTYVDLIEKRLSQLAFNEAAVQIVRAPAVTPVTKAAA